MSRNVYWSKLCPNLPDLLRSIFESLTGQNPLLYDPVQDKNYDKVHCLASYSNWLLIVDYCLHFHLLNVFTRETINLPSLESSLGDSPYRNDLFECFRELYGTKFLVTWDDFKFSKTAVLWINERNGDFVVAWAIEQFYIFSYKKIANDVTIYKMRIAIANSGEVMIFLSLNELNRKFCICELNLQVGRVGSLGDQLLIFGHGVTFRGPVKDRGIKSDSVCLLMMIICLVIICGEERSKVCVSSLNITNEYLNHKCFLNQGIYNSGSEYKDSLNILFRKVRTDDYARTGFMHLTKGPASDSVTVMFQCRGDSYGSKCRTCADTAVAGFRKRCPRNKGGIIWYDQCFLWVSAIGESMSIKTNYKNIFSMYNPNNVRGDAKLFAKRVVDFFSELTLKVKKNTEAGSIIILYAAGEKKLGKNTLYAMVQCVVKKTGVIIKPVRFEEVNPNYEVGDDEHRQNHQKQRPKKKTSRRQSKVKSKFVLLAEIDNRRFPSLRQNLQGGVISYQTQAANTRSHDEAATGIEEGQQVVTFC
uniref:Gnk2-homologous domain-containing protein n=1 Tax=Brassica campestris TaxID=3711 RepID=M4CMS8_BRACM